MAPILVAKGETELFLLPQMANRHGLIAGATGTGKTVTLQLLVENFSALGVPVFMADIKGDLSGISQPGGGPKVQERVQKLGLTDWTPAGCPVTFWDVFGEQGHPVRTTVTELGPLLLARLLQLNEIQAAVLTIVFRVADENGLLLLDFKDLRTAVQYVGDNAKAFSSRYGNISLGSVGAIQRALLALESQGADRLFGEPALNLDDLLQTDPQGRGIVNLLAADRLLGAPKVYATLLLWMLSDLYERLPEVGDLPKPKLIFVFDEAHLLFADIPAVLLQKVEQVIRLIRSKGVGVYFATQNPRDVPDNVLGQLGNRWQHALRGFTPRDQKAIQAAAETFRTNPHLDAAKAISELGVGEALVSLLDEEGHPTVVQRAFVVPPRSQIGAITPEQRRALMESSLVAGIYDQTIDRESAYEKLTSAAVRTTEDQERMQAASAAPPAGPVGPSVLSQVVDGVIGGLTGRRTHRSDTVIEALAKSMVRSAGTTAGREIVRGIMGSLFGGMKRGR
ncbi:MAG: DUF853 family protein [Verrucomicrobia bacterium]|nr:DUF853 family protein [Verrucomicrobiota bacterium]